MKRVGERGLQLPLVSLLTRLNACMSPWWMVEYWLDVSPVASRISRVIRVGAE